MQFKEKLRFSLAKHPIAAANGFAKCTVRIGSIGCGAQKASHKYCKTLSQKHLIMSQLQ